MILHWVCSSTMINLVHGRIFMSQKIFHHLLIDLFLKKYVKILFFFQNLSNLLETFPDLRDIFKYLSLKSEYPLKRGPLNRGFLTLEKPEKIWDQTLLSLKCGYPLNRNATKMGFHCIRNVEKCWRSEKWQKCKHCLKIESIINVKIMSKNIKKMLQMFKKC